MLKPRIAESGSNWRACVSGPISCSGNGEPARMPGEHVQDQKSEPDRGWEVLTLRGHREIFPVLSFHFWFMLLSPSLTEKQTNHKITKRSKILFPMFLPGYKSEINYINSTPNCGDLAVSKLTIHVRQQSDHKATRNMIGILKFPLKRWIRTESPDITCPASCNIISFSLVLLSPLQ